jgi:hypothetical protein
MGLQFDILFQALDAEGYGTVDTFDLRSIIDGVRFGVHTHGLASLHAAAAIDLGTAADTHGLGLGLGDLQASAAAVAEQGREREQEGEGPSSQRSSPQRWATAAAVDDIAAQVQSLLRLLQQTTHAKELLAEEVRVLGLSAQDPPFHGSRTAPRFSPRLAVGGHSPLALCFVCAACGTGAR